MINFSAGIKTGSLYAHRCTFMFQTRPFEILEFVIGMLSEVLNIREEWCLGPESNRHDPVKESQDFKSRLFFLILFRKTPSNAINNNLKPFSTPSSALSRHQNRIRIYSRILIYAPFLRFLNLIFSSPIHMIRGDS